MVVLHGLMGRATGAFRRWNSGVPAALFRKSMGIIRTLPKISALAACPYSIDSRLTG